MLAAYHFLSTDKQLIPLLHANGNNVDLALTDIDRIKSSKPIIRTEAEFPIGLKSDRLFNRFAISDFNIRFKAQLILPKSKVLMTIMPCGYNSRLAEKPCKGMLPQGYAPFGIGSGAGDSPTDHHLGVFYFSP